MNSTYVKKRKPRARATCSSYVKQINELEKELFATTRQNEALEKEADFLRWSIVVALVLGIVIGAVIKRVV